MVGYKIHFDGEKFVADNEKTPVETVPGDSFTGWFARTDWRDGALANLNEQLKTSLEELVTDGDFVMRKCKECGNYFGITKLECDWFTERKLSIPVRCAQCRRKRKTSNAKGE